MSSFLPPLNDKIREGDVETRASRPVIQAGFLGYQVENVAAYLVKVLDPMPLRKASNSDHTVALSGT